MTIAGLALDERQAALLRDAATWRLIGRLFERPQPGWLEDVARLAAEVGDPALREAASRAAEATEGIYLELLGPGGLVSPREVGHAGMREPGQLVGEISAFYGAFAYHPAAEQPLDHVSVEAGFVAYLRLKEAYAQSAGQADHAQLAADAARDFLAGHLAVLAPTLTAALDSANVEYLALAAKALKQRVPELPQAAPRVLWMMDESWDCGSAPETTER